MNLRETQVVTLTEEVRKIISKCLETWRMANAEASTRSSPRDCLKPGTETQICYRFKGTQVSEVSESFQITGLDGNSN
jgi:Asp/Glu/hydantoin racemase